MLVAFASVSVNMALSSANIKSVYVVLYPVSALEWFPHNGVKHDIKQQGRRDISLVDLFKKEIHEIAHFRSTRCWLSHWMMLVEVGSSSAACAHSPTPSIGQGSEQSNADSKLMVCFPLILFSTSWKIVNIWSMQPQCDLNLSCSSWLVFSWCSLQSWLYDFHEYLADEWEKAWCCNSCCILGYAFMAQWWLSSMFQASDVWQEDMELLQKVISSGFDHFSSDLIHSRHLSILQWSSTISSWVDIVSFSVFHRFQTTGFAPI